jgi:modulator of FtsH protease HflC
MKGLTGLILAIAVLVFIGSGMMIVDETEQVVIIQLGKPVRNISEPGLHFKIPFLQSATYFENRLLEYDSAPNTILTKDKKNLIVDNYAQWRIIDPLKFLQSMRTISQAQPRLDDIIYSSLRIELGTHDMHEIINLKRDSLMQKVTVASDISARDFGVQIIDVRIKRADLPKENEMAVFDRMRAERNRMAKQFRSEGAEENVKIKAKTDRDREIILAKAYREAQLIRGDGEAEAIRIYAEAFSKDSEFYEFVKTMETYETIFDGKTKVILSPKSELFKYLKSK